MENKPIRVLIIEDDEDEAGIIGSYLADAAGVTEGFELSRAPRISTACHLLGQLDFDAILIDLVLPQSVGLEGFLKIRELKPAVPLIVLTGLKDEPLAIQALALGAQDYLIKGSPDCCLLKRSIRYAIEKKRLSNMIEGLLGAASQPDNAQAEVSVSEDIQEGLRELKVKKRLMLEVSHELRNTLATVKTAAYCLKQEIEGVLTPRQVRMVDMIARNVDRQTKIIDDLLDLTRLDSGYLETPLQNGGDEVGIWPGLVQIPQATNGRDHTPAAPE